MNRYAHEFGPDRTDGTVVATGRCIHCGAGRHAESPSFDWCRDRQRRHDAFVAAAMTGMLASSADWYEIPEDAVSLADKCMAELAKP